MFEPDGVVGPHPNPVRNGPVLPHLLGELLLDPKGLVGRLHIKEFKSRAHPEWKSLQTTSNTERANDYHFRQRTIEDDTQEAAEVQR